MTITLNGIGKKFNTEWIFRNLTAGFEAGERTVITGRNGSGKSTLLQVIAGNIHPTAGTIEYILDGKRIPDTEIFRHLSLVAPYQELIEEFTLREMLEFHFSFKPLVDSFTIPKIIDLLAFSQVRTKPILKYSSGMKQRVKLVCALLSDTPLLLLDEPTTNLDKSGINFFLQLITDHTCGRTILVCSNMQKVESEFCRREIRIEEYK
ncbi:MAG: ATP-binding cassette domain-containing protein [Bacteroidales bacterium]|nr:ATP-binding cassette domain-containing protein [Bacteroidales bacterium]